MSNLRKYILAKPWEIKTGSVTIETAATVYITEERADALKAAGIILGEQKSTSQEIYKKANRKLKDIPEQVITHKIDN
jgi:hypothetical protein